MTLSMDGLRTEVFDESGLVIGLLRPSTVLDEQPDGTVLVHSGQALAVLFEPDDLEKLRNEVLAPHDFGPQASKPTPTPIRQDAPPAARPSHHEIA